MYISLHQINLIIKHTQFILRNRTSFLYFWNLFFQDNNLLSNTFSLTKWGQLCDFWIKIFSQLKYRKNLLRKFFWFWINIRIISRYDFWIIIISNYAFNQFVCFNFIRCNLMHIALLKIINLPTQLIGSIFPLDRNTM